MTPSIIQTNAHLASEVSSLAFTSNVGNQNFLFCVVANEESIAVSDNVNGEWTILATGEAQETLPYTIAYLPVSAPGATTVSFKVGGSPASVLPFIAEISSSTLEVSSAVASGTIPSSSAVEFTSAQIAATAGQLLLGYGFGTGNLVQSAGGSYDAVSVGAPPVRVMLETQTATSGEFNSDFFTVANATGDVWVTGIISLAATVNSISGNAGVAGATVAYSGTASGSVTADGSGNFTIPGLANGSYTITPTKAGFSFLPASLTKTVSGSNITGVNFTSTLSSTSSTVVIGCYRGSSFLNAFPQNLVRKFDVMQIINRNGKCVWKLDHLGVVTVNPTSSTNGTLLGQYLGSNWNGAFISGNQNPSRSDMIQVKNEGGDCIWRLDYTGTVYSL